MMGLPIYAMLGWIIAPLALGAIGGLIAQKGPPQRVRLLTITFAVASALACTTTLATIDKLIGPW